MAEVHGAVADALRRIVVPLWASKAPRFQTPWYLAPEDEQRAATAKRGLSQLLRDFPGNVAQGTEFPN